MGAKSSKTATGESRKQSHTTAALPYPQDAPLSNLSNVPSPTAARFARGYGLATALVKRELTPVTPHKYNTRSKDVKRQALGDTSAENPNTSIKAHTNLKHIARKPLPINTDIATSEAPAKSNFPKLKLNQMDSPGWPTHRRGISQQGASVLRSGPSASSVQPSVARPRGDEQAYNAARVNGSRPNEEPGVLRRALKEDFD